MRPDAAHSPTLEDVAAAAEVSKSTASRALLGQERVSGATQQKVQAAADELGYVPNVMAAQLAHHSSSTIGLMLRDAANPAYGLLFTQLHAAAQQAGLRVLSSTIRPGQGDRGLEQLSSLQWLMGLRVSGLIVATGGVRSEDLLPFHGQIPIIRAGRPETSAAVHAVSYDEPLAARELVSHVCAQGHRRVAVLRSAENVSYPEYIRASAMLENLEAEGVEALEIPVSHTDRGVDRATDLVEQGRVTAVMCPSDMRQLELIRALQAAGFSVPEDVSVSGCDGVIPGIDVMGLTSYRIGVEQLAERVIANMQRLLQPTGSPVGEPGPSGVVRELIPGRLLEGRTVGTPHS